MAKRKGWNLSGSGLELPIALVVLGPLAWFGAYSLTGEDKAVKVAEDLGYTNVQVVDKKPVAPLTRACSASDTAQFRLVGVNSKGDEQEVTVCARTFR